MAAFMTFINAGKIEEIKKKGCLKTSILGRYVMVCYFDGEIVALDIGSAAEILGNHSVPTDFHGLNSMLMDYSEDSLDGDWGKVVQYPVRIEGEDVFVGSNPL